MKARKIQNKTKSKKQKKSEQQTALKHKLHIKITENSRNSVFIELPEHMYMYYSALTHAGQHM